MSRAEYMREYRAKQKAIAAALPFGTRLVIGDGDGFYLARIAELEAELRALKAELARHEAAADAGVVIGPGEPPATVTADGTRGMRRGVSRGGRRPAGGAGPGGEP